MEQGKIRGNASGNNVTVAAVAQEWNVSERTVHNWVQRGILTYECKVGKVLRFNLGNVKRDLKAASSNGGSH